MPRRRTPRGAGASPTATVGRADAAALHVHHLNDPLRERVESYICQRYRQRYGANITESLPVLVSLQADGEILAAAGYRDAYFPLFLERYLSAPVERYLGDGGRPVARHRIVEVGHFAAMRPGAGRRLVPLLAMHLHQQGYEWAVSTLTSELHHLFSRMGLAHRSLALASEMRLDAGERADWGDYYAHRPEVFAGHLKTILERFREHGA
ncbi:thermostable hemolysin [Bordetella genomosp. 11]|uniref:Thermostable hemolysin n=1 Tax=Bordetella genomosp. 11 TaxID=1416808 RepID=A0A261UPA0_9BORD|nr:thermostable hemolysin [Bordetella genomosp. 11]